MEVRSPRANRLALPRWLNARLGAGVLLVLLSTLLGARVVAAADTTELVWAARRDLPTGYRISAGDVAAVSVRLGAASQRYVAAAARIPDGYVLGRAVVAGELLPRTALVAAERADPVRRVVAVPVRPGHWPHDLSAGDVVDLYATPKPDARAAPSVARLVLSGVPVQSAPRGDGGVFSAGDGGTAVELSVPASAVASLVLSIETSEIDVVRTDGVGGVDSSPDTAPEARPPASPSTSPHASAATTPSVPDSRNSGARAGPSGGTRGAPGQARR